MRNLTQSARVTRTLKDSADPVSVSDAFDIVENVES